MTLRWKWEAVDGTGTREWRCVTPWGVARLLPRSANGRHGWFLTLPFTVTNADVTHVASAHGMHAYVMPSHQFELFPSLTDFAKPGFSGSVVDVPVTKTHAVGLAEALLDARQTS